MSFQFLISLFEVIPLVVFNCLMSGQYSHSENSTSASRLTGWHVRQCVPCHMQCTGWVCAILPLNPQPCPGHAGLAEADSGTQGTSKCVLTVLGPTQSLMCGPSVGAHGWCSSNGHSWPLPPLSGVCGRHPPSSSSERISHVYMGPNFYWWPLTQHLWTSLARLPQAQLKPLGDQEPQKLEKWGTAPQLGHRKQRPSLGGGLLYLGTNGLVPDFCFLIVFSAYRM